MLMHDTMEYDMTRTLEAVQSGGGSRMVEVKVKYLEWTEEFSPSVHIFIIVKLYKRFDYGEARNS